MVTSSIIKNLANKNFNLMVENKNNPYKFRYKNNKFSLCIRNIGFAYRTNKDEYRVQIGEKIREKLRTLHIKGYWALIFGYHKKSKTYTAWDNKLLFSSKAKNRSLYTRDSICNRAIETGLEHYRYTDNLIKEETVSITFVGKNLHLYLDQIRTLNLHQYGSFINFYRNLKIRN
jgi:hypothetical protein|tara:strand:- start:263 stop:784 length:522 start_codon:yes stop_codon:yes gene_type:complete